MANGDGKGVLWLKIVISPVLTIIFVSVGGFMTISKAQAITDEKMAAITATLDKIETRVVRMEAKVQDREIFGAKFEAKLDELQRTSNTLQRSIEAVQEDIKSLVR